MEVKWEPNGTHTRSGFESHQCQVFFSNTGSDYFDTVSKVPLGRWLLGIHRIQDVAEYNSPSTDQRTSTIQIHALIDKFVRCGAISSTFTLNLV